MEKLGKIWGNAGSKLMLLALSLFSGLQVMAQERGIEIDVNKNGGAWYTAWWVWVGLALFVIVLVSIVSAGKRT